MPRRKQVDQHLLAIEVNALRLAEIATLRRDRDFWRQRGLLLEALAVSFPDKFVVKQTTRIPSEVVGTRDF